MFSGMCFPLLLMITSTPIIVACGGPALLSPALSRCGPGTRYDPIAPDAAHVCRSHLGSASRVPLRGSPQRANEVPMAITCAAICGLAFEHV